MLPKTALAGYGRSRFDVDARASSGEADSWHLGAYAGTRRGALGVRAGLAYSWHEVEVDRTATFFRFADRLESDYDAGTFQAFAEAGWRIDGVRAAFEPYASLAHVRHRNDGFLEAGGAAALDVYATTTHVTYSTLGLRAATVLGPVELRGGLGWRHAFDEAAPSSVHAFSGGDAFTVTGAPIARDAAVVEAGLGMEIGTMTTLSVSYDGQFGDGAQDHGANARLDVRF